MLILCWYIHPVVLPFDTSAILRTPVPNYYLSCLCYLCLCLCCDKCRSWVG